MDVNKFLISRNEALVLDTVRYWLLEDEGKNIATRLDILEQLTSRHVNFDTMKIEYQD